MIINFGLVVVVAVTGVLNQIQISNITLEIQILEVMVCVICLTSSIIFGLWHHLFLLTTMQNFLMYFALQT